MDSENATQAAQMIEALARIAEADWHTRNVRPNPNGGIRGKAGMIAAYALTGRNGSYIGDAETRKAADALIAALPAPPSTVPISREGDSGCDEYCRHGHIDAYAGPCPQCFPPNLQGNVAGSEHRATIDGHLRLNGILPPASIDDEARELLAAEFDRIGWLDTSRAVRSGNGFGCIPPYEVALRAITAALQPPTIADQGEGE